MEDCCNHSTRSKKCIRKKDKKTFKLPRRFSKKKCRKVRGFTMRSSCAPYKYCKKGGGKTLKNINNKPLRPCSKNPLTGYYRDGYCKTGEDDIGTHTICARMDKQFMEYTKNKGNNLYSVVKPGEKWCLCENRWYDAYKDHKEPFVIKSATNYSVKKNIKQRIMESNKRGGGLPILRKIDKSHKKHIYKLADPQEKRILAMNEGIRDEMKKGKTKRQAALSKKKRFNVLRLYRKNKDPRGCKRFTKDMRYLDKRYKTGKTTNICKKQKGRGKHKLSKKKDFLYNPNNPKKSFDVYIDKNPQDTIPIKYKTYDDVKRTIRKLERLYKQDKYSHKRIWQVGMIMYVRLKVLKKKKPKEFKLSERYFKHLGKRTKIKGELERKKYVFKI